MVAKVQPVARGFRKTRYTCNWPPCNRRRASIAEATERGLIKIRLNGYPKDPAYCSRHLDPEERETPDERRARILAGYPPEVRSG